MCKNTNVLVFVYLGIVYIILFLYVVCRRCVYVALFVLFFSILCMCACLRAFVNFNVRVSVSASAYVCLRACSYAFVPFYALHSKP